MEYEQQYLYLTTTGRTSGMAREIEIWFAYHEGRFYVISEHCRKSHWVQNIINNPRISFRIGDQLLEGVGRVVEKSEEPDIYKSICRLFDAKYGWSNGLIVELAPDIVLPPD